MNPTKADKIYWSQLASLGCVACRIDGINSPDVSIHHITGRSDKGSHLNVIPLCGPHHQTGGIDAPAIHPWKTRFIQKYGTQEELKALCDRMLGGDDHAI